MAFLPTDQFGFLCQTTTSDNPKEFTIIAWGQAWSQQDHTMVIFHKWETKQINWKDLGNTMQLIRLIPNRIPEINENTDMSDWFVDAMYSVLGRYTWYDEVSNTSYHYIPKISGKKMTEKLDALDLFSQWGGTTIIDEKKGRFALHHKQEHDSVQTYILAEFFWLCFIYGKPTIQKNVLTGYKIQIPILDYTINKRLEKIIENMRWYGFVVNIIMNHNQQVCDITTNDYTILAYIRILLGEQVEVILIDKVLEIQKEIFIQYGVSSDQKNMRRQLYEVKR